MIGQLKARRICTGALVMIIVMASAIQPLEAAFEKSAGCFDRFKEHLRMAEALARLNDQKKALVQWQAILDVEPNSIEALQGISNCLYKLGDYAGFIRVSQRILDLNPASGATLLQRIIAFQKLNQSVKANAEEANFNKYGYGHGTFAFLFTIHGGSNSDQSIKRLEDQIALTPTCPDLYLKLVEILGETGQNAEVIKVADRGIKTAPLHSWVWRMLESLAAKSYFALGDKARSKACFDKALEGLQFGGRERPKIPPHAFAQILLDRSEVHLAMNQVKDAIGDLTLLIDNQFPRPTYYVERARRYLSLKQLDNALKDCNDALLIAHENIAALEARSLVLTELKRYEDSAKDLTILISHAKDQTYYLQRATNYELAKQYEKALADYEHIIRIDPKEVMAYEQRARIYRSLGKTDLAAKDEAVAKSIKSVSR